MAILRALANISSLNRWCRAICLVMGGGLVLPGAGDPRAGVPMSPEWAIDACLSCHIPEEAWPAYLELLAASGVRTLRERGIGTREADGRYRGDMRPAYRRLKAAGHQVVAFAGTPVPVVQVGNVLPEDLLVVYAHAQHLGRDFAGLVDAWEMVGEPDVGYCPDLPDRVAAYQKALYLGIKAGARSVGAPAPAVLMGALALPPGPWLERAVRNGLLDYTDAYNFHYYGHPEDLPGVIAAHARVAARGKVVNEVPVFPKAWWQRSSAPQTTDLPLWITECGIEVASAQDFLNPQRRRMQAEYTQKTAQVAWGDRRVALFMPFILAHEKDPHALTLPGAVPLPAWTTYAEFTRRPPWPARRLVNPPPAPNPLVVQWLPDNRTTRPHKVSGTYRMVGDLTVTGELRFYNFSARAITGRVVETALRRIQREGRLPETLTVPPGEMRAVPVSFKKMAPTGYVREDWTVTFAELGGALTAVSFALETEPVSGDFEKRPWPVLPPIGDTLKHPVDAWDDIGSISGRWRGLNQLRVEEVAGDTIRVSTRQLTGDPLRGRQALARVGPLPANGFIRLELERPFGKDFAVGVDLIDRRGQRFTIWENSGVSYFNSKVPEVWLNLRDFQIYFWGRCTDMPVFKPGEVEELQFRFMGNQTDDPRTVKFSVMVPRS